MISLTFRCGGCEAQAEGTTFLQRKRTVTVQGADGSWGYYTDPKAEDVMPEGWIAFDPWTQCTYCPKCWADLEAN